MFGVKMKSFGNTFNKSDVKHFASTEGAAISKADSGSAKKVE
jgi:hypothetical protein